MVTSTPGMSKIESARIWLLKEVTWVWWIVICFVFHDYVHFIQKIVILFAGFLSRASGLQYTSMS